MVALVSAFFAAFIQVFLKSIQQLNVMHHKTVWVVPVSFGMAFAEAWIVYSLYQAVLAMNFVIVFSVGAGGALGALSGMNLHKALRGPSPIKRIQEQDFLNEFENNLP